MLDELAPEVLLSAYSQGAFPMDVDGEVCWFSPDPRAILPMGAFHVSRTLGQTYRRGVFEIRIDTAFGDVIRSCSDRPEGTWISREMIEAYTELHRLGLAHSVEAWREGTLAGGLYGVTVGGTFLGESMFHRERDASKVALVALVERMRARSFALLDVQWITEHLRRFGVIEIPREEYLGRLAAATRLRCSFVDKV